MKKILEESIGSCINYNKGGIPLRRTQSLYPFTTENIGGYIGEFDLENRSLLTVGSSGDQVINAALFNCRNITLLDIATDALYYYYLKVAGLLSLTKDEFYNFFKYYSVHVKTNHNVFNKELYNKLKDTLRCLNKEAYEYFKNLFSLFSGETIRINLFQCDEDSIHTLEEVNPYLSSDILYLDARNKIKNVEPKFINKNIFDLDDAIKYDNIWLSNIATWLKTREDVFKLFNTVYPVLNEEGKLLFSYLYLTTKKSAYRYDYAPVYNLDDILNYLSSYSPELIEFPAISGFDSVHSRGRSDGAIIVRK